MSKNYNIEYIFDDNKLKQNLCLPGTLIKIKDPKFIKNLQIDVLIIFAWNYSDFIIKKNTNFKNKNGKFLIPFPNPKLV